MTDDQSEPGGVAEVQLLAVDRDDRAALIDDALATELPRFADVLSRLAR